MMSSKPDYSFTRYLTAKKTVDDRSINRYVYQGLKRHLPQTAHDQPVRILEVGSGVGTMIERLIELDESQLAPNRLFTQSDYTALDAQKENTAHALERFPAWASEKKYTVRADQQDGFYFCHPTGESRIHFLTGDVQHFSKQTDKTWDLLIANAFLDLFDIPSVLPVLFKLLKSSGLFYFTINFDAVSTFEPVIDPELDAQIESLYHRSMDHSGDSRSGRHLFHHLKSAGANILEAGASDWVVYPGPSGYPDDEEFFLHYILHFFEESLHNHPELDQQRFASWLNTRHAQVEQHELVYIAHQIDFVGSVY